MNLDGELTSFVWNPCVLKSSRNASITSRWSSAIRISGELLVIRQFMDQWQLMAVWHRSAYISCRLYEHGRRDYSGNLKSFFWKSAKMIARLSEVLPEI